MIIYCWVGLLGSVSIGPPHLTSNTKQVSCLGFPCNLGQLLNRPWASLVLDPTSSSLGTTNRRSFRGGHLLLAQNRLDVAVKILLGLEERLHLSLHPVASH